MRYCLIVISNALKNFQKVAYSLGIYTDLITKDDYIFA